MLNFFHVQRASLREITRNNKHKNIYFSVVCLEFFVSLEKFSLNSRHHFCRRRAGNFDLCSALMVNEQWGFFSGRHHLWQGAYVYNGHFWNTWGLVTFTPNAERLTVKLSIPDFKVRRGSNTHPSTCKVVFKIKSSSI